MADDAVIGSQASTPVDLIIAADEIAGKKFQRVKLVWGVDGAQVDASGTDPLPVTVISGAISVSGTMPSSSAIGTQVDGHSANIGLLADAASASTLTGLLKNIKAALAGTLTVTGGGTPAPSTAVAQTSVACSASSATLLSSNTSAKQRTIVNDSTSIGYLRFNASAATTSNFSIKLQPGATYEFSPVLYNGEIRAISDTATGNWRISEWT